MECCWKAERDCCAEPLVERLSRDIAAGDRVLYMNRLVTGGYWWELPCRGKVTVPVIQMFQMKSSLSRIPPPMDSTRDVTRYGKSYPSTGVLLVRNLTILAHSHVRA